MTTIGAEAPWFFSEGVDLGKLIRRARNIGVCGVE